MYIPAFEQGLAFALRKVGNGHLTLKKEKVYAIRCAYDQEDIFVWLPTGFGKSIVYECLPFLFDYKLNRVDGRTSSVVLVVSPLVALMIDQVEQWSCRLQFSYTFFPRKCGHVFDIDLSEQRRCTCVR